MNLGGIIGLTFGVVSALVGIIIGQKQARKSRADDEVHDYIWKRARSYSWYATLLIIYVLLLLSLLGVLLSTIKVLSVLLIVHLFTWASVGLYLSAIMFSEEKADKNVQWVLLALFIVLGTAMLVITIFFL
ncbi:MAG TPA: hypothetical protein VFF20_03865 [Pseudogracilibacillus sp.]|nr:hypothetical protein [Pseudogracilibacillus sp.]